MGMNSPAAEAMIDEILNAKSREDFIAATRALDRVLTSGRYVIPSFQNKVSRLAYAKELQHPERLPIDGDWFTWQPDVWWWQE
jgi:peptide/nickel transport system substrate-binding protein